MSSAAKSYVRQMAKHIHFYATWLPTAPLALGDYGLMEDKYLFRRLGNITELGVSFEELTDESQNEIDFKTSGAVSVSTNVSAKLPGVPNLPADLVNVETTVSFGFSQSNSVVFKANGVTNHTISRQPRLGRSVMELFSKGQWEKNWKVITGLVEADAATIIVAKSSSSELKLVAEGDVRAVMDLANAGLGLTVAHESGMAFTSIARSGLTPLFQISGIKRKIFSDPTFEPLAFRGVDEIETISSDEIRNNLSDFGFGRDEFPLLFEEEE